MIPALLYRLLTKLCQAIDNFIEISHLGVVLILREREREREREKRMILWFITCVYVWIYISYSGLPES